MRWECDLFAISENYVRIRVMQEEARMGNQLVSIGETAKALAVSKDTIRRLIDRKELRAVRVSRRVLIPTSEIERACAHGVGINCPDQNANR